MNKNYFYLILFFICLIIFTAISLALSRKDKSSVEMPQNEPESIEIYEECPAGFKPYVSEQLEFCYPTAMELVTDKHASGSSEYDILLSSEEEELRVVSEHVIYPVHLCTIEKEVTIASQSAIRASFKTETVAGCGQTSRYVINSAGDEARWSVDLRKHTGTYQSGEPIETIKKSLIIRTK